MINQVRANPKYDYPGYCEVSFFVFVFVEFLSGMSLQHRTKYSRVKDTKVLE
jgi:hypothetical protein